PAPIVVQIAGGDAQSLAEAARLNADMGAQIIDIDMGCPAKKVCKKAAGSALLKDEKLVADILQAVVGAVSVPVTLKCRTGWSPEERNALRIARIAEDSGIAALAMHGRTRACGFSGTAEYDTIAAVVQQVRIPVICNGDINSPVVDRQQLEYTGAHAELSGTAAQVRPWIFRQIDHYQKNGAILTQPPLPQVSDILVNPSLQPS